MKTIERRPPNPNDLVDVVVDRVCNKCGQSMRMTETGADFGLLDAQAGGGEGAAFLSNLTEYVFDLCEGCLVELMDSFVISPQLWKAVGGNVVTYAEDRALHRKIRMPPIGQE